MQCRLDFIVRPISHKIAWWLVGNTKWRNWGIFCQNLVSKILVDRLLIRIYINYELHKFDLKMYQLCTQYLAQWSPDSSLQQKQVKHSSWTSSNIKVLLKFELVLDFLWSSHKGTELCIKRHMFVQKPINLKTSDLSVDS